MAPQHLQGRQACSVDIGGEVLKSTYSEKLLGLYINSDFKWDTHIDEISAGITKKNKTENPIR